MLHLVNPCEYQPSLPDRLYGGKSAASQDAMDAIFRDVCQSLGTLENVGIHRQQSDEFLATRSASFDSICIDGDHRRQANLTDLSYHGRGCKDDGSVAGDDYYWRDADGCLPVKQAVDSL